MSERNKHIDELFRQSMGDHQEDPPPHVWESIEQRLNDRGARSPLRVWWFWSIVGILLISTTAMVASYQVGERQVAKVEMQPVIQAQLLDDKLVGNKSKVEKDDQDAVAQNKVQYAKQKIAETEQNRTIRTQNKINRPEQKITVDKPRQKEQLNRLNNTGTHNITQSISNPVVEQSDVKEAFPRLKDEPGYMNTKTVGTNEVQLQSVSKQPVRAPEVVADKTKLNTNDIKQIRTDVIAKPEVQLAPTFGVLTASNNNLLTSFKQSGFPTILNLESQEEDRTADFSILQSESALNYHDTTKKKKHNKKVDTLSDDEKDDMLDNSSELTVDKARRPLPIEFGIKLGYSKGTNSTWSADKVIFAPYAMYDFSEKVSLVFQPAYQTGRPTTGALANANTSYYEVRGQLFDSTSRVVRGAVDSSILTANPPDTLYNSYTYTHLYDSVHVYYGVTQKQLWDIELPLLVKYKVHNRISILAGVSATYTSVLQTREEVTRFSMSESQTEDHAQTFYVTAPNQSLPSAPVPKDHESLFSNSGIPYSEYQPRTVTNANNFFRYGYMIGVSANYKDRWMLDLIWHQTGVDKGQVTDKNLQKLYTQPYIRMTIGYKLFKN